MSLPKPACIGPVSCHPRKSGCAQCYTRAAFLLWQEGGFLHSWTGKPRLEMERGTMRPVEVINLRAFARTPQGKPLNTRVRSCPFHVHVANGEL